jgi:hypothetical protein
MGSLYLDWKAEDRKELIRAKAVHTNPPDAGTAGAMAFQQCGPPTPVPGKGRWAIAGGVVMELFFPAVSAAGFDSKLIKLTTKRNIAYGN